MHTVAEVVEFLKHLAPLSLAEEWDNVGLLLGDPEAPAERVMTCLTVTPASAAEAVEQGARLIITHHPILFRPVQRLTTATPEGRMLVSLIQAGVAVYSAHTAFDNAPGGINDMLAARLHLTEVVPLRCGDGPKLCKIVVFVPDSDLAKVSDALFGAGAGNIGQYSQCSFRLGGTGTFFGSDAANPTIGQKGRREEVSEWRLEAVCPEADVDRALAAMRRAHSYEEPAYDVYSLRPTAGKCGRVGLLPSPVSLTDLARQAGTSLNAKAVQIVGDPAMLIRRLALACGAGGDFLADAEAARADAFLTGEMRFHDCLAAQQRSLAVILPGHFATERFGMEELAGRLQEKFTDLTAWASQREKDPLQSV